MKFRNKFQLLATSLSSSRGPIKLKPRRGNKTAAYRHVPARRAWRREILPLPPLLCREYRRVVPRCKTRDKKTARTWRRDCARQLICAIARNNYRYRYCYCFCLGKMPSRRTGPFLLQGKRRAGERTRDGRCLPFPMRLVGHHNVERQSASYPVSTVPRRKRRRAAIPRFATRYRVRIIGAGNARA